MIEQDLPTYLNSLPAISSLVTVYDVQPPNGAQMPYALVEGVGGPRERSGANKTEETILFRVSVDCGPDKRVAGRNAINEILKALENYRGDLGDSRDVYITCGAVRSWAGIAYAYRYMFEGRMRSIEPRYNG